MTPSDDSDQSDDTDSDLLVNTFGTDAPSPNRKGPSDDAGQDGYEPFQNRASRRAQQREDAHARRTR